MKPEMVTAAGILAAVLLCFQPARVIAEPLVAENAVSVAESAKEDVVRKRSNEQGELALRLLKDGRKGEAADIFIKILEHDRSPSYLRALASIFADAELYAPSLTLYGEALKATPDDLALLRAYAETLEKYGRVGQADEIFTRLVTQGDTAALVGRARIALREKRYQASADFLERAVATGFQAGELHRLLGEAYLALGKAKEAELQFSIAGKAAKPEDLLRQGDAHLLAGEHDKAVAAYRAAAAKRPDAVTLQKLGVANQAAGNDEEALATYREALAKAGESSDLRYRIGVLYERKGDLRQAEQHYIRYLASHPRNGDARRRLADLYTLQGSMSKAADQYRELLRLTADNPLIHYKLASVLEGQKKYPEAINELKETVRLDPENVQARKELADLYRRRGFQREAEGQYVAILQKAPADTEVRASLTALFVEQKKFQELLQLMVEGAKLTPEDPQAHYKLGIVQEFLKDHDAAIESYEKAINLKRDYGKALQALGRLYYKQAQFTRAKETLEAAKKADPSLLEVDMLLTDLKAELAPKSQKEEAKKQKRNKPVSKKVKGKPSKKAPSNNKKKR